MTATPTYDMALRTGNWGALGYMLSFHAAVSVQLAPEDEDGVLVRLVKGLPRVPRDLRAPEVTEVSVHDAGGTARLTVRPADGLVARRDGPPPEGAWELRIVGDDQQLIHLYALPGTDFPSAECLEALARAVSSPAS